MSKFTHSSAPAILVGGFAALGGFLFGYDTGTISGVIAMPSWLAQFAPGGLTTSNKSLVVSILSLGEFLGALAGAPVSDRIGRRWGIIASCVVFIAGVAMQTGADAIPLFAVGRFIAGLGVGLISCLVPMYQSECSPKWIRGGIVATYQWAITIGLLLAAVANNSTKNFSDASAYRIPIGVQMAFGGLLGLGMLFLPESPRYYVRKGNREEALKSVAKLNSTTVDDPYVADEVNEITNNFEQEKTFGTVSYLDCFKEGGKSKIGFRTHTGIWLQGFQQLTGINFIFYYGTTFFQNSGFSDSFLINVITNGVNVAATVPGMYLVDKLGRRNLLLYGALGMCICEYIVAIVGVAVGTNNLTAQIILVVFVCIYIAFFAATWGPIAWIVTGEIYPLNVRAKAMSMSTASNWFWNFLISYITPYMVDSGAGNADLGVKVFFIWGTTCATCFIFAYFTIFETKGLSLEQIDELYIRTSPRESQKVRLELVEEYKRIELSIEEKA